MSQHFNLKKVEKLPNSEAQITGEITLPFLVVCRKDALKHLSENVKISGFRSGHIPEDILVKNVGEMRVLEEAAEIAIGREYGHIIKEADVLPVSRPEIAITKLAPGTALEFKINVAIEPEFQLPDYKKLAKAVLAETKDDKVEVTDKEVGDTLAELEKRGIKPDLPAGDAGINEGEKLEDKVKESLLAQKQAQSQEKKRLSVIEKLVKETEVSVPKALLDAELARMLAQFKGDIERMGVKWEDYITQIKKSEEEIKNEWQEQALQRVKAELIIAKIAAEEKIEPTDSEITHEVEHLVSHYPDADPLRARVYIYTQIRNQKVLEFLESQK